MHVHEYNHIDLYLKHVFYGWKWCELWLNVFMHMFVFMSNGHYPFHTHYPCPCVKMYLCLCMEAIKLAIKKNPIHGPTCFTNGSWELVPNPLLQSQQCIFFHKCIIELMLLIIHKWWKPHGKVSQLAMSRGKRLQTYVRVGMKAQLMVDGILDPHLGWKAPWIGIHPWVLIVQHGCVMFPNSPT